MTGRPRPPRRKGKRNTADMDETADHERTKKQRGNVGPLAETEMTLRVSYRDTDQMGHVYYANYLVYFEMARTDLLRQLGRTYRECEERGIFLPVSRAECHYKAPALYDDLLRITTRVVRWTRVAIDFEYECRREDGALLATGTTCHVLTDRDGRIIRAGDRILPD